MVLFNSVLANSWDDMPDLDHAWDGQKTITNQAFEKVMDAINANKKKKEEKQKKKKIKKISGGGDALHKDLGVEKTINKIDELDKGKDGVLLNIPVRLILDDKIIEKGYYNVYGEKGEDGNFYINFYQAQYQKGKVKVIKTEDDFDEETVNFIKLTPYNDSFVRIIYGSIDFNAYAFIPVMAD